jgi:hypothetical protein
MDALGENHMAHKQNRKFLLLMVLSIALGAGIASLLVLIFDLDMRAMFSLK